MNFYKRYPGDYARDTAELTLIEHGVYLMESLDLEELARDQVYEFCFVALPLKIRGATASMIDPLAVV